jgi:hypothetical protein
VISHQKKKKKGKIVHAGYVERGRRGREIKMKKSSHIKGALFPFRL